MHRLLDRGYVTIDPDTRALVVSTRLGEDFHNGRAYYALHGRPILPAQRGFSPPSRTSLQYHADHVDIGAWARWGTVSLKVVTARGVTAARRRFPQ